MKRTVIPTVFAHSASEFKERFAKLVKVSPALQIDFMDGELVPAKSMPLSDVPSLKKYNVDFEAHLMVAHPEDWIVECMEKGFTKIIIHIEALKNVDRGLDLIHRVRSRGARFLLAINPETSMEALEPFLPFVKDILVMGVHPGKEHQSLAPNTARRVSALKSRKGVWVQVDGGVNDMTIGTIAAAGADAVNSGSFVADASNPKEALKLLEKKFEEGKK